MWANAAEKGVMKYLGTTMRMIPGKWPVIWVGQYNHKKTSLGVCENCANAKATQKNMPKISTGEKATVINGRWFHDSSTLKVHKVEKGSSKIWDLTVDGGLTGFTFTGIYNKKNEFVQSMC